MFRKIIWAVQDFFEFDVPNFIDRINVIGRMREAESEASRLWIENRMLNCTLYYGATQHNHAVSALKEIHVACAAVGTPNGTTKKLGRIAGTALAELREGVRD